MQNEMDRLTNELEELKSEMDLTDKEVVKLLKQVILEKPDFCGTMMEEFIIQQLKCIRAKKAGQRIISMLQVKL